MCCSCGQNVDFIRRPVSCKGQDERHFHMLIDEPPHESLTGHAESSQMTRGVFPAEHERMQ